MKKFEIENGMIMVAYCNQTPEATVKSEVLNLLDFYNLTKHELKIQNGNVAEALCQFIADVYIPTMGMDEVILLDNERRTIARVVKNRIQGTLIKFKDIRTGKSGMTVLLGWTEEKIACEFLGMVHETCILPDPNRMQVLSKHPLPLDREIRDLAIDNIVVNAVKEQEEEKRELRAFANAFGVFPGTVTGDILKSILGED
jgi:hypothetical protein